MISGFLFYGTIDIFAIVAQGLLQNWRRGRFRQGDVRLDGRCVLGIGRKPMTAAFTPLATRDATRDLTFDEFLVWDDGSDRCFELVEGVPVPLSEPNANHEDVADELSDRLQSHCRSRSLPYVVKRAKQVRLKRSIGEKEASRKPDIVVFDRQEWERMKGRSSPAAAYVCPPMVIEVVSTNWRDDYLTKLAEYEELGVAEYWIVDFAALGGIRFIGDPKQATVSIYTMVNGEYQVQQFRDTERLVSRTFPDLDLTAIEIFSAAQ
jgi:Uma2 family endonuclease